MKTIFLLIVIFGGAFYYLYSGRYNVAAMAPHTEPVEWMLTEMKEKSIEYHSRDISTPALDDPSLIEKGFGHYDNMCSGCHGAPGADPAKGFNPPPPALAEIAGGLEPRETFWVVKHGIKMTAMPEFGSSHTDDEIWTIAAFVKKLPDMTVSDYDLMKEKSDGHTHENGH
ncbi:MAG: c-type cytochrome [Candidatus Dadabacteria bacterium]|nr:c-type cytochrome [Candidatus Dadabacteria bacterium]